MSKRQPGKTHDELVELARRKVLGGDPQGHRAVFFDAVSHGDSGRVADAVSMVLWRSRGHVLAGYEAKASRADWLRELREPAKADGIVRFLDRWWLVANRDVVADGELPEGWGLYVPHGGGLRCLVEAPKLDPDPISRSFLASLMRRSSAGEVRREADRALEEARAVAERAVRGDLDRARHDAKFYGDRVAALESEWAEFRDAMGEDFPSWRLHSPDVARVGQILLALDSTHQAGDGLLRDLQRSAEQARRTADIFEAAVAGFGEAP